MLATLPNHPLAMIIVLTTSFLSAAALSQVNKRLNTHVKSDFTWAGSCVDLHLRTIPHMVWNQLLQTLAACRRVIGTGFQLQRLQGLPARVQVCITWLPQPPFHAADFVPITPDTILLSDRVTNPHISLELKVDWQPYYSGI